MKAVKEICIAGRVIDVTLKMSRDVIPGKRKQKKRITPEAVQANNDRIAAKNLARLINANFGPGDIHLVLTYGEAPSEAEAKKDRTNFIRRLKHKNKEIKWIAVTEKGKHGRIHHHIIIKGVTGEEIVKAWPKGWANIKYLDASGDYTKLAEYLIKYTSKAMREPGAVNKRRFTCSGNLERPVVKKLEINTSDLFEDPEPIKGYFIPKDSIRRYEHPVTGIEHLEYRMLAIDKPRPFKKWPRGKITKEREYFRPNVEAEDQEDLFSLLF